jgi:hypothetical protein
MGGHLTDLKTWLFARSEGGKNIKKHVRKFFSIFKRKKLRIDLV